MATAALRRSATAHRDGWATRVALVCGAVLAGSPLLMNPWGSDQYQLPRLAAQAFVLVIAIGALMVDGLRVAWPLVPLGSYLGVLALAALLSAAPIVSMVGTDGRHFGVLGWLSLVLAFTVGLTFDAPERRRLLLHAVVAVSVPMSLYACLQRGGIDPFAAQESTLVRPVSTVGNAAFFGAFLAVAIVAAFGLMLDAGRRWWWWAPIVVIDLVALVLTDSRGAWLGVVAGLLFVGWRSARVGAWRPVVVAGAALTTVVLILSVVVPGVALRAASIVHVGDGTAGARLVLDGVGVRAVAQRPLLGWGPDMSRAALHAHIPSDFEVKYLDARIEDRVHNVFLDIAVWGGLVGLACFVWFLVALVRNVRRRPLDPTAAIVVGACVAFGVHLLFNFPVPEIDMVIWLLLGSVVSSARRLPPAPAGAVAPAVVLGVALMTPSLVGSLTADRQVRIGVDREQAHDTPGALTAYRDAMSQSGNGAVYSEITTRALLRAHQPALAVDTARRLVAADTSDPYARELLASALNSTALSTGNTADAVEAEAITRHLLSRYPFDGSMHLELGNALAAQHHIPEAEAEFLRASELVPSRSDVWRNLAIVAELQHDPAAERYWRISLWLNPTDATARAALDRIHATG